MISFSLNVDNFVSGIQQYQQKFFAASQKAVLDTSRVFLTKVIEKTPKPPTPTGQVYQRTGRLAGGWGPAAVFLGGIGGSSYAIGEGTFEWTATQDMIRFVAVNEVPYAYFVEVIGPWLLPPQAPGGPKWRGGEFMVTNSVAELSYPGGNLLTDNLAQEMSRL